MKNQKLPLSFGLVLILLTCFISTPLRVYAGSANVVGASDDSSSSSGDNVSPVTSEPIFEAVPGSNVEVNTSDSNINGEINISASPEVQDNVNEAAEEILQAAENASSVAVSSVGGNILSSEGNSNSILAIVVIILKGGTNSEAPANELQSYLGGLGVSQSAIQGLISALRGMIRQPSASTPGLNVGSLKPVQLIAGVKGLNTEIAQNATKPSVDLNKLNAAITAYNKIVMESNPEVLHKLAKDPQFLEIGKVLKQLRTALKKR